MVAYLPRARPLGISGANPTLAAVPRRDQPTSSRRPESDAPREQGGTPADARDAACRVLTRQARAFPLLIPTEAQTGGLDARDAALAHAIHDSVIRRWLTLSILLESASGRDLGDLEPAMRAVLLSGAAQLLLLDRIPPHAAIDQSVEWAKRRIRPKAGAMVNAILRRTAELSSRDADGAHVRRPAWTDKLDEIPMPDGSARVLSREVMPAIELDRLSIATSMPRRMLERWVGHAFARGRGEAAGAVSTTEAADESHAGATSRTAGAGPPASSPSRDLVRARALHGLTPAPTIINTSHAREPIAAGDPRLVPHRSPGHHVWTGPHADLGSFLGGRDDVWVQDPASSASVAFGHAQLTAGTHTRHPPRVIADVCAGQGTKTRQLAALFPEAEILATDTDEERLVTLRGVFAGHPRVRVLTRDELVEASRQRCDLILLDVPCSNTGVLARRPEARYRLTERTLDRMADVQRQIGADSILLLAPKGRVLYATCSLEPEENEQMAAWFTRWHNLRTLARQSLEPSGLPGQAGTAYRDGSFAVVLGR